MAKNGTAGEWKRARERSLSRLSSCECECECRHRQHHHPVQSESLISHHMGRVYSTVEYGRVARGILTVISIHFH